MVCQIDWLCQLPHDDARRRALTALPPTLHATYQRILRRVNEADKEVRALVCKTLRWLVCSQEKLSSTALCEAISVGSGDTTLNRAAIPGHNEIRRWCSSLVRNSVEGDFLELAHFTVQEYLLGTNDSQDPGLGMYHFSRKSANIELAKICLTYLAFEDFNKPRIYCVKTLEARQQKFAFLAYAVKYWEEHVRMHLVEVEVLRLTQQLLHPSKPHIFISWAQERARAVFGHSHSDFEDDDLDLASTSPLHFAAALALPEICFWLMSTNCNVRQPSALGNPLDWALLGSEVMIGFGSNYENFSYVEDLSAEQKTSRSSTIKLIIEGGADVNVSCVGSSPISIAALLSDEISCVELLRNGATLDTASAPDLRRQPELADKILMGIGKHPIRSKDRAVLLEAALHIEEATSDERLAEHARNAEDDSTSTTSLVKALIVAAQYGQINVLRKLLIDSKLNVNALDKEYDGTALHAAASKDHIEIVKTLLDHGADCNLKDKIGKTVLHRSLDTSSVSLPIILEHTDDIDLNDDEGITAWHLAAFNRNVQALRTLSRFAADGKPQCSLKADDGRTPIHCAAQSGCLETLSYLMDCCAAKAAFEISADGSTLLHYAVGTKSLEVVRYLIDKGFDLHVPRNDGSSLLHCTFDQDHAAPVGIVDLLIEKGIDPCQARSDGMTAIDILILKGQQLLYGYDPLYTSWELEHVLGSLLRNVTELEFVDTNERSALYQLCQIGVMSHCWGKNALKMLLETGTNLISQDRMRHSALRYTIESWTSWTRTKTGPPTSVGAGSLMVSSMADTIEIILAGFQDGTSMFRVLADSHILCLALMWRQDRLAHEILQHTPSVDVAVSLVDQMSPFEAGCFYGSNSQLLKKLIQLSKVDKHAAGSSWSLFRAVFVGTAIDKRATTNILLDAGFDANDCNSDGESVLMIAARNGDAGVVEDLVEHGADIHAMDNVGWSILQYACESASLGILQILLCRFKNWSSRINFWIGEQTIVNATVLHFAAADDNASLQFLLQNDLIADVNCLTIDNQTPLHIAAYCHNADNISLLLDSGSDDSLLEALDGRSALHIATWSGSLEVVKVFVEKRRNLQIYDRLGLSPELIALKQGHTDIAKILREGKSGRPALLSIPRRALITSLIATADVTTAKIGSRPLSEPLRVAIEIGDTKLCETLIAEGANCDEGFVHCKGCTPVLYACIRGEFEVAKLLVSKNASMTGSSCSLTRARGWTPFHHAAASGDAELLRALFERASYEMKSCYLPVHPLHLAVANDRVECVKLIVADLRASTRSP